MKSDFVASIFRDFERGLSLSAILARAGGDAGLVQRSKAAYDRLQALERNPAPEWPEIRLIREAESRSEATIHSLSQRMTNNKAELLFLDWRCAYCSRDFPATRFLNLFNCVHCDAAYIWKDGKPHLAFPPVMRFRL